MLLLSCPLCAHCRCGVHLFLPAAPLAQADSMGTNASIILPITICLPGIGPQGSVPARVQCVLDYLTSMNTGDLCNLAPKECESYGISSLYLATLPGGQLPEDSTCTPEPVAFTLFIDPCSIIIPPLYCSYHTALPKKCRRVLDSSDLWYPGRPRPRNGYDSYDSYDTPRTDSSSRYGEQEESYYAPPQAPPLYENDDDAGSEHDMPWSRGNEELPDDDDAEHDGSRYHRQKQQQQQPERQPDYSEGAEEADSSPSRRQHPKSAEQPRKPHKAPKRHSGGIEEEGDDNDDEDDLDTWLKQLDGGPATGKDASLDWIERNLGRNTAAKKKKPAAGSAGAAVAAAAAPAAAPVAVRPAATAATAVSAQEDEEAANAATAAVSVAAIKHPDADTTTTTTVTKQPGANSNSQTV